MSIQRYLEQLIEEIDEKMKIPAPGSNRKTEFEDYFLESDELDDMMEYNSIPLTKFSKILKESLPPPDRLNLKQTKMLVNKISGLLENWNYHLEYPKSTPVKVKYRLIYDHWEEFGVPTSGWHYHQDFCTGDCEDCVVSDNCESYKEWESGPIDFDLAGESIELHPLSFSDNKPIKKSAKESPPNKLKIKQILHSIQEKDFIFSMHNYCDRWCENCTLKSKCSVFYFEKELLKLAANDNSDRSSFESVKHIYKITHEILSDKLNENDVDFEPPVSTSDSIFPKLPSSEQKVLDFAKEYTFKTSEWLRDFPEEKVVANHDLLEPLNTITHYNIFISTKLARAFFGRIDYPEEDPIQNDSNGSAKVALIAIARSLDSWSNLLNYLKDNDKEILNQCVKLKKLKKMVEKFFPHAQEFLRPGFDFQAD